MKYFLCGFTLVAGIGASIAYLLIKEKRVYRKKVSRVD